MISWLQYLRYFLFIRRNWNTRLAMFTLRHEIRGEKKYKINTSGYDTLERLSIVSGRKESAYIYQPVNYFMLEKALGFLVRHQPEGSLVDFGCGRGRILAVAAAYGFKNLTGVEFAPALCQKAEKNMATVARQYTDLEFKIYCDDATTYPVTDRDSVFTFFNPFDGSIMLPVVKNILQSVRNHPREIYILYFNPTEAEIFLSAGFKQLWYYRKMRYLDVALYYMDGREDL